MTWFTRLRNWVTDQSNGIGIRADYHDSEDDNFATGINQCLNIAGLNSPTSNIPMGGFKITGAGDGTSVSDYATLKQIQYQTASYAIDSSGTDSYSITPSPSVSAYVTGQVYRFYPATANTGAASLNVSSLGAKTIKKDKNTDLVDNDIQVGQLVEVIYDGTNFQMLSPIYGQVNQSGSALYAADGGASDTYVITLSPAPAAYATGMVIRFKANTANTGAASLNVNSLGAKTIKKEQGLDLNDNDIKANQIVEVIYDGTNFQMLSPASYAVTQNAGQLYAADSGSANAYAITLSPAPTAYVTGQVFRFKAANANTTASTLNVNSLGTKTIKKLVSFDVVTGDILSGQTIEVCYDGTNFQLLSYVEDIVDLTTDGSPDLAADYCKTWDASASTYKKVLLNNFGAIAATQAQMEAASSTTTYVSPGKCQNHPGISKGWVVYQFDLTPSVATSYNVTSITDNGTADHTINWTTVFSSSSYAVLFGMCNGSGASVPRYIAITSQAAGSVRYVRDSAGSPEEATFNLSVSSLGDQ